MKSLIIAVCIIIVVDGQLDKLRENFRQMLATCKETVGASDAEIDQYNHGITPSSDAGKCLIACVNKIIKIQDANGNINPKAVRDVGAAIKNHDEKWYNKLIIISEKCIRQVVDGADECEIGADWFTCISKGQIEAGLPLVLVDE